MAGDETAAILYTSGTTSDPKGVMLTHDNINAESEAVFRLIDIRPSDAILGILPLFHALAQMANLILPLGAGARVVYLESLNTTELQRGLRERDITLFCCVPQFYYLIHERIQKQVGARGRLAKSTFRWMLKAAALGRRLGFNPGKVLFRPVHQMLGPKMRYLITGGSRLDPEIGHDFQSLGFELLQAYGLTETSGGAVVTSPADNVIGSVGKPLYGNEIRILNAQAREEDGGRSATHAVGEIALRGPIVMKGYYKRPDATAEVLRDGWLHTGDLGYLDAHGNLFITGREKEVIVLSSGKNVYPEEIEAHYLKSPFIKEICVVGLQSQPGEPYSERLHGVVVPNFELLRERKVVNTREVIRFDIETLSAQLPSTKRILSFEVWQEELPRTTTRKLKRFEIERRVQENQKRGAEMDAAGTRAVSEEERSWTAQPEVQRALAVIRERAKKQVAEVHPRDNLELDLGLDSMERVELLVALEKELGADVPDSLASEVYTVREMVEAVRSHAGEGAAGEHATAWDRMLAEEPADPDVLSVGRRHRFAELFWFIFGRFVNLFARDFFGLRVSGMENLPKRGPFILSPNHQSFLDPPVLISCLPYSILRDTFYVGTSEIFGSGVLRLLAHSMKLIPVDPDANLIPAMRAGAYGLRHGKVLVLYPEGERSIDGSPKVFKKGAAILSLHLQVPIVPVAMDGFFEAWPRGKGFQGFHKLRIAIGEPLIPPREAASPEAVYEQITDELRTRVAEMWEELQQQGKRRAAAAD
jgi:long-chain acyl-CoA synthetase